MKSINVVKLMQYNKNLKNMVRKDNTEERRYSNKVKSFVDTYVVPKLKNIDLSNINYRDEVIFQAFRATIELDGINLEETPEPVLMNKSEVGFLHSNDIKIKAKMGNRIAKYVVRDNTYDEEKEKYIEIYINPILKKLVNEKVVVYDKNALDNKTKIANKKMDNLVSKFIDDNLFESRLFVLFEKFYGENYINKWDIIFGNDIQAKRDFATMFYNYVKDNIDNIDFKNLKNIDFAEVTGANLINKA